MRKGYTIMLAVVIALIALFVVLRDYFQAHWAQMVVLNPAGPVAFAERSVIIITFALCAIVVVPVFVMLFFFAWKYRASNFKTISHHLPEWDHTRAAEIICWLIPSIIITVLAVLAWESSHTLDPYQPLNAETPITIQVVALDWKWLFIYPGQNIASVNLVEFPQHVPIRFELTSDAPMNSFWIPQLGGQIMAMPGMSTQLNLMADRVGDFNGFSGNISGDGFAGMAFTARAVSQSDFNAWVQSMQQAGNFLDTTSYHQLAAPSEYNPVTRYAPVQENLYTSIIMHYMQPDASMSQMSGMEMTMPMGSTTTQ
jgi:cytochrome o ubiquinol oxidase subunit 2